MFSAFHIHKRAAHQPQLIEHIGDFETLGEAHERAAAVLESPLSGEPARVEVDHKGVTVSIVRRPGAALKPRDFMSWYTLDARMRAVQNSGRSDNDIQEN